MEARLVRPDALEPLREAVLAVAAASGHAIARGMGRSYGDAAQLRGGLMLETTRLKGIALDRERGVVVVQAGVTLGELLAATVPAGWVVPVVPGTQHVSVGGAIASDIHGKNHGSAGTFGRHVQRLGLLAADGELLELAAGDELFEATVGGMGLTGVIVWAEIRLQPTGSGLVRVDTDRVVGLDAILDALRAPGGPYRVAWVDLLAPRPRAVVTRAALLGAAEVASQPARAIVAARAEVPAWWPAAVLRPEAVRAFNALRFRMSPRRARGVLEGYGAHMFPLDALVAWPRLYGREGFVQYQFAVPPAGVEALEAVPALLRRRGIPCYLCVLKDFGASAPAPLSFPLEGWTITFDLPRRADGLYAALDACDEIVLAAGGRVYLAKDDRLRPETMAAMYPRLGEWQRVRERVDPERVWASDLAVRAGLVEGWDA